MRLAFALRVAHCAMVGLAATALLTAPALVQPAAASDSSPAAASDNNSLDARQFRIENARIPGLPGIYSARQTVYAWQVTTGTWNGQTLDGLCLVVVQSQSESGSARQTNCYISHEASQAQREALLGAFVTTQPQILSARDLNSIHLESAVITLEVDGQTVVLHLGLIA
jgi:hypothetical protein